MRGVLLQNLLGKRRLSKRKRERKDPNIVDQSLNGRKRQDRKDSDAVSEVVVSMDFISQLPDHIIHQILSNLPTEDVARTSVLSRKWKRVWDSYPIMDCDQRYFRLIKGGTHTAKEKIIDTRVKTRRFQNFVDRSFQTRRENNFNAVKFRLYMTDSGAEWVPHMDRWITAAIESNVKELDVHVEVKKYKRYIVPQTVLGAEKLTRLSLYGCKLENFNVAQLPLLKNLCLKRLNVNEQKLQNFLLRCPLIEDLRLISCSGLKNLKLSSINLKRAEVHFCHGLKSIDLEAQNLQIFWYFGKKSTRCKINLSSCESLKRLTLEDANMTDELFQDRISKFPVLEQLILSKCNSLKRIKITNYRLKGLGLRKCQNLVDADIDTPNLLSFDYDGNDEVPFSSLDPSGLLEAKLSFHSKQNARFDLKNLAKLEEFLNKSSHSRGSKLVIRYKKNVTIHGECKGMFFPPVNELKIELMKPSMTYEDLIEDLLCMHHPENLGIVSSPNDEGFKLLHDKLMGREKEPNCCQHYSKKCWRHYLEEATFGFENKEWTKNEMTNKWIAWLNILPAWDTVSCVRLKWKSENQDIKEDIKEDEA